MEQAPDRGDGKDRLRVYDFGAENDRRFAEEIRQRKERLARVFHHLLVSVSDVQGYAIVMWDEDGHHTATLRAEPYGPVCANAIPAVAHDALLRGQAEMDAAGLNHEPDDGA